MEHVLGWTGIGLRVLLAGLLTAGAGTMFWFLVLGIITLFRGWKRSPYDSGCELRTTKPDTYLG